MIGQTPTFSASEFVAVFNQSIEMMFPVVGVVGELASFRISKGQWLYFDLKDDNASVKFFGTTRQLPGPLEDGMRLEVLGRPYLHPRFGFSIQIMSLRPVGEGTIKKAQDLLQAKLQTEGLFEVERKRQLPYPPERIALITSREAAAYSDFTKIIAQRWPVLGIDLFDSQVQGQEAPMQLVRAIEQANQMPGVYDAIVMIRGGGSVDDMAAFSTEPVVRAVAASRIPTVVAIGHERDISLAELASDQRASTPSNAAELLVPDQKAEKAWLSDSGRQLDRMIKNKYNALSVELLEQNRALDRASVRIMTHAQESLTLKTELLRVLNPVLPLQRGFALVRGENGQILRRVNQAKSGDALQIALSDGNIAARVD